MFPRRAANNARLIDLFLETVSVLVPGQRAVYSSGGSTASDELAYNEAKSQAALNAARKELGSEVSSGLRKLRTWIGHFTNMDVTPGSDFLIDDSKTTRRRCAS